MRFIGIEELFRRGILDRAIAAPLQLVGTHSNVALGSRSSHVKVAPQTLRGFTLLELMVVIVLIAIMAALVLPEMKGSYEDAALRSAARKLADAFAAANGQAITVFEPYRVRIDAGAGRYAVERARGAPPQQADIPGGSGTFEKNIIVQVVPAEASPESEEKSGPPNVISFNADGTCDSADIVLRDRQGYRLVLRLNPITSRVRVLDAPLK